ncbi:MAG TPA: DUF4105 domain-containing protein [Bdellovibrionota bacterium]|jgi:hypothetical protein
MKRAVARAAAFFVSCEFIPIPLRNIVILFILISAFFFSPGASAASSSDPAWRALLHFSGKSGGKSSVAEKSQFFLSPDGFKDPEAELQATLQYFDKSPVEAACRYPARALYLGRVKEGKSDWCERWSKWRTAISAKGAELVLAGPFISSPSAMYGHTLLKFVRSGRSEGEDLLDYTLNYGANTGSVVGIPYVWLGLTGGFNGSYATAPFYLKVKEYNYVENRDFWIYPLKLTDAQLRLLVAHSWELREVEFPYFFLHRNCSFYLLELLEVVRPGSELNGHFPFWTVPIDTIRLLTKENFLGTPRHRASRYRRLKAYREQLSSEEKKLAERLAESGDAGVLPEGRETLILDSAYELWRYRTDGKKESRPEVERKLLDARSHFFLKGAFSPDFSAERPPELGHPSARLGIAAGTNRLREFAEISYRGTLHDLLADPHGYEDYSELSMGDLRVRVEDGTVFLERFDFLRLRSVAPMERWIPRWSWSFRGGLARAKEFACSGWNCLRGGLEGGGGLSANLGPVLGYALWEFEAEAGKPFDRSYRLSTGPSGGIFTPLWKGARMLLEGEWHWRFLGSRVDKHNARLGISQTFSRTWEARLQTEVAHGYREGLLQLMHYF